MKSNTNTKFKPGQSGNPKGRPRGAKNRNTVELKEAISTIIDDELKKAQKYLTQISPKERLDFIVRLLPYILPKISQIEHSAIIEEKPNYDYSKFSLEALEDMENSLEADGNFNYDKLSDETLEEIAEFSI